MKINDSYPIYEFKTKEDVFYIIDKIKEENKIQREKGNSIDLAHAISIQLPFFCCTNMFLNKESQDDINKYMYCKNFKLPPYPGCYGDQPGKWIEKSFIIENAFAVKEYQMQKKASKIKRS